VGIVIPVNREQRRIGGFGAGIMFAGSASAGRERADRPRGLRT
jgi:hypothetical protein